MLAIYQSKTHPRKFSSKAVKLNLEAVRPDPSIRIEENRYAFPFSFSSLTIFGCLQEIFAVALICLMFNLFIYIGFWIAY